jgi:hypothetical protein
VLKATAATEIPWTGRTSKGARHVHIHLRNTSGILMSKVQALGTPRGHKPTLTDIKITTDKFFLSAIFCIQMRPSDKVRFQRIVFVNLNRRLVNIKDGARAVGPFELLNVRRCLHGRVMRVYCTTRQKTIFVGEYSQIEKLQTNLKAIIILVDLVKMVLDY